MPKTVADFEKSSDFHVANPFRYGDEVAKADILYEIQRENVADIMKDFGASGPCLVELAAALARAMEIVRRVGTTVEALAQQGELVGQMAARMKALPIYKGVYKAGERYSRGNFVTHSGSVWHCNIATSDKPGGGNPSWTLAVKSGARGGS